MYNTNDLCVKYLDDENEEVTINSQEDLEYAYQVVKSNFKILVKRSIFY